MSKNIIILVLVLIASAAFGASYSDGVYQGDYYVASASSIVDINAKNGNVANTDVIVVKDEREDSPVLEIADMFNDVSSNFNVDVNAAQTENKPVTQVDVNATYTVSKGAFNVQFAHARSYSRTVDDYAPEMNTDFAGTVNNRVTFGISFSPEPANQPTYTAANTGGGENVGPTASLPTVKGSSVN